MRGTLARDGCSRSSLPSPERPSRSPVQGGQIGSSSELAELSAFLRSAPSTTSWLSVGEEGLLPDLLRPTSELDLSTDSSPRDSLFAAFAVRATVAFLRIGFYPRALEDWPRVVSLSLLFPLDPA